MNQPKQEPKTKQAKTGTDMSYDFPLPMDEGGRALMNYINETYGNRGKAVSVSIIKGQIVVKIDPLGQ